MCQQFPVRRGFSFIFTIFILFCLILKLEFLYLVRHLLFLYFSFVAA